MKKSNRIILFLAGLAFVVGSTLSVNAHINEGQDAALKFEVVALIGLIAPAVALGGISPILGISDSALMAFGRNVDKMYGKTKEDVAIGNILAVDDTLYVRKEITSSSGILKLIETQDSKTKGIRNIDRARLPQGYNFAIEGILLSQGSHATVTDPKRIANYTPVGSSFEAELRNAELVISQNTKEIVRIPVSSLVQAAAGTAGSVKDLAYSFRDNIPVLVEQEELEINLEFAEAVATASSSTNKFHVEVQLFGKKTMRKKV